MFPDIRDENIEDAKDIAYRAGKYSVWEKLFLFFENERSTNTTAEFICKWAEEKMKTHKSFHDKFKD